MSGSTTMPPQGLHWVKAPERHAASDSASVQDLVAEIIAKVRTGGDAAVREFSARFDTVSLEQFEVDWAQREAAIARLAPQTRKDTEFAIANVRRFAEAQFASIRALDIEILPGVHAGHRV